MWHSSLKHQLLYHFAQFSHHALRTWVVWPKLKLCPVSQGSLGPFSGSVRAPGACITSGVHHIRQVAKHKILSTWSQFTPLAKLNKMVQYRHMVSAHVGLQLISVRYAYLKYLLLDRHVTQQEDHPILRKLIRSYLAQCSLHLKEFANFWDSVELFAYGFLIILR